MWPELLEWSDLYWAVFGGVLFGTAHSLVQPKISVRVMSVMLGFVFFSYTFLQRLNDIQQLGDAGIDRMWFSLWVWGAYILSAAVSLGIIFWIKDMRDQYRERHP